jgi:hypothetical protein
MSVDKLTRTRTPICGADSAPRRSVRPLCPCYPGKRYEDWLLEDLAGKDLDTVRRVRDQIRAQVHRLVDELRATP